MTSCVNYFFFVLWFFFHVHIFCFFLYFVVFLYLITAVASLFYDSLLLFIFTYRWSTVHHTWVTVLGHVRVPSSCDLLIGQVNVEVAFLAKINVNGTVLELHHLASGRTRRGPCALVIKASLQWAPGSISQLKLLRCILNLLLLLLMKLLSQV